MNKVNTFDGSYIAALAKRIPTDDNVTIGEDGLQYCKTCLTARQCRVELFGKTCVVPCVCKCMSEKLEREERKRKQEERARMVRDYQRMGFSDRDMAQYTFEADDGANPRLLQAMRTYAQRFGEFRKEGKGLLLYGPPGTGKTFYAASICNALTDQGYPCLMTNFSRLINMIQETWEGRQARIDGLTRFSMVAIDDLGVERDSSSVNEAVTTIIDGLYRAKIPMIVTSNDTPKQLAEEGDIRRRRV